LQVRHAPLLLLQRAGQLVRFFRRFHVQPFPYIPDEVPCSPPKKPRWLASLCRSTAAPCLNARQGEPAHDRIATAPNFLQARGRLNAIDGALR